MLTVHKQLVHIKGDCPYRAKRCLRMKCTQYYWTNSQKTFSSDLQSTLHDSICLPASHENMSNLMQVKRLDSRRPCGHCLACR